MKKLLKYLTIFSVFINAFIVDINVFSYTFIDPKNEAEVEYLKQEIYDLQEQFYKYYDVETNDNGVYAYYGVCSTVNVDGKIYTLEEYVAGVVKAEIGAESDSTEALRAHAIAARTYLLKTTDCSSAITNSQSYQTFKEVNADSSDPYYKAAMDTAGMVVMKNNDLVLTEYTSYPNAIFTVENADSWEINFQKIRGESDTAWVWKGPAKDVVLSYNNYKPQTGAPSLEHHYGMSSVVAVYLADKENYTYEKIIKLFYGNDVTIQKLADGNYVGNLEFVSNDFGNVYYYNQLDYPNLYYSTDVSTAQYIGSSGNYATIASHGCGPTSLAIIVSSYKDQAHTPAEVTQKVCQAGACTGGGSFMWGLKTVAEQYGYSGYYANGQTVLDALGDGNLVIALMGPGTFTTGGHFIVLTGVRSDGFVSVADPASRNRTQQKWFSFSLVVEQSKGDFLVIEK